eukprot:267055_1
MASTNEFGAGLFNICADGCGGLCCALFCGQCYYARTRTMFDESNCVFNCLCVLPPVARSIIREGYGIEGGCLGDMCLPLFCPCCVGIQLRAEVNERGPITRQNVTQSIQNHDELEALQS